MTLTPEAVEAYLHIMENPAEYNFDFKPLSQLLVKSDKITAQHILYREYIDCIQNSNIPKVIFYIILQDKYGACHGKDDAGCFGYYLTVQKDANKEL